VGRTAALQAHLAQGVEVELVRGVAEKVLLTGDSPDESPLKGCPALDNLADLVLESQRGRGSEAEAGLARASRVQQAAQARQEALRTNGREQLLLLEVLKLREHLLQPVERTKESRSVPLDAEQGSAEGSRLEAARPGRTCSRPSPSSARSVGGARPRLVKTGGRGGKGL
jgi:hypothetical protein